MYHLNAKICLVFFEKSLRSPCDVMFPGSIDHGFLLFVSPFLFPLDWILWRRSLTQSRLLLGSVFSRRGKVLRKRAQECVCLCVYTCVFEETFPPPSGCPNYWTPQRLTVYSVWKHARTDAETDIYHKPRTQQCAYIPSTFYTHVCRAGREHTACSS